MENLINTINCSIFQMQKVIFSPHLNFRRFERVKNFYLMHRYDIKPDEETEILRKPKPVEPIKVNPIIIEPIDLDEP